ACWKDEALKARFMADPKAGRVRCVDYPDLVHHLIDGDLPAFLGYEVDETTRERMHAVSREYSKEPDRNHEPDSVRKARIVSETPSILRAVERLQPLRSELLEWSVPAEPRR
ncbi:MAG: hypothetical protein OSA40_12895, partial [Phycisphaerales bacterium]|nr:hypothetical protein [Phycisphaerales bacterium]